MLICILVSSFCIVLVSGRVGGTFPTGSSSHGVVHVVHNTTEYPPGHPFAAKPAVTTLWINTLGIVTAVVWVIAIVVFIIMIYRYKRRDVPANPWKVGLSGQLQRPFQPAVPLLSREELESACEDFSNIIGSSPDGVV